jgi:hypothetical protein
MTQSLQPLQGVSACVFDAYGTLFDFASAAARCVEVPAARRSRGAQGREVPRAMPPEHGRRGRRAHFGKIVECCRRSLFPSIILPVPAQKTSLFWLGNCGGRVAPEAMQTAQGFKISPQSPVPRDLRERQGNDVAMISS